MDFRDKSARRGRITVVECGLKLVQRERGKVERSAKDVEEAPSGKELFEILCERQVLAGQRSLVNSAVLALLGGDFDNEVCR